MLIHYESTFVISDIKIRRKRINFPISVNIWDNRICCKHLLNMYNIKHYTVIKDYNCWIMPSRKKFRCIFVSGEPADYLRP